MPGCWASVKQAAPHRKVQKRRAFLNPWSSRRIYRYIGIKRARTFAGCLNGCGKSKRHCRVRGFDSGPKARRILKHGWKKSWRLASGTAIFLILGLSSLASRGTKERGRVNEVTLAS